MIPYEPHQMVFGFPIALVITYLGIFISYLFSLKLAQQKNLDKKQITILTIIFLTLGMWIGARIFYFFGPWGTGTITQKILNVLNITIPGMVFYGGLYFSIFYGYLYMKNKNLNTILYSNIFAITLPLAHFFGRIGCFFHGCCRGKATLSVFGFQTNGAGYFPTQIISSINALIIFITLLILNKKYPKLSLFPIYLIYYSITRFIIEFFRYNQFYLLNLSFSQWLSIPMLALGIILIRKQMKPPKKQVQSTAQ